MKHSARILMVLLVLSMMLAPVSSLAQEAVQGDGALVVGSTSALTGEFYLDLWGNNTTDVDVRRAIHGYGTIIGQETAERRANPLSVARMEIIEKAGNKTFVFHLQPNMVFSDGTEITARNYVLSLMLTYHPLMRAVGGTVEPLTQIVGGKEYQAQRTKALKGVRLLDERSFSVTLAGNALPDYNELRYVDLYPSPLHVLLPGMDIVDNGNGVEFTAELTVDALRAALEGENGYRSHPSVSSGPYVLASYDAVQRTATLVRNEMYTGIKPSIERIRIVHVANDEIAEALQSGRVHLVNKITHSQTASALAMTPGLKSQSYPRQGFAYLGFAFERAAVRDIKVRKALAHSIDRMAIINSFLSGKGMPVNGYYGIGQWMAQTYMRAGKDELKGYAFDLELADKLIRQAGYSEKKPLKLTMLVAENNAIADAVAAQLEAALKQFGGELAVERKPYWEVLDQFYRRSERTYDLVFAASNFDPYFEPALQFGIGEEYQGTLNRLGINERAIYNAARAMRATPANQPETYYRRWIAFQQEIVKALPVIPLYSNYYTDVFTDRLTGYDITARLSWIDAVLNAHFQ